MFMVVVEVDSVLIQEMGENKGLNMWSERYLSVD